MVQKHELYSDYMHTIFIKGHTCTFILKTGVELYRKFVKSISSCLSFFIQFLPDRSALHKWFEALKTITHYHHLNSSKKCSPSRLSFIKLLSNIPQNYPTTIKLLCTLYYYIMHVS